MAIQYFMRAYNTNLSKYVDWAVNDTPDSTGAFSGFPTNQLINITVNRVVQSKVANFLKPNESLGGNDGYFFHVNSYDWKNVDLNNPSFSPITRLAGISVENGLTALSPSSAINGATNVSPIVITLSSPPTIPLVTGEIVTIIGVTGNTNANGTWPITVIDTTHFSLNGSTGSGTYTVGSGNAYLPTDAPSLIWDPTNSVWRFVLNTNGDGVTLGASQSVKVNNFIIDGYEAFGFPTASQGIIRLPNNQFIFGRNSLNNGDVQAIGIDNFPTSTGSNRIKLGALSSDFVFTPGNLGVDGYIQHNGQGGLIASTSGFINDKNTTTIVAFRNAAGLLDIAALSSSANNIVLGDATNTGIVYNTSTANIHQFQINSVPSFEIGNTFVRFPSAVTLPTILQTSTATANATGQTLVVQAQNSTNGGTVGGILSLTSGTGTNANGSVDISTGGNLKVRIFPATGVGANSNSIQYFDNLFRVDTAQTNPLFRQDDVNAGTTNGQTYTVQAQNAIGASSAGGILALTSGTGTTNAGQVQVQTGGTTQIIVSPLTIPPGGTTSTTGTVIIRGNLEVVGTTTTVDSTVVDIIGRVIHANWADPISSPNVAVPSQNVGYSVHRGNVAGVPRDGAAWIWSEGAQVSGSDGYWRAVTLIGDGFGTDNFTPANSPFTVGILGNAHIATSDPNPINGYLPNVGGLRVASSTPAVVARNTNVLTTIAAGSNLASLPQATINVTSTTGFTTAGTLLIISSTGTQTVTYTGVSGGNQFTGAAGGAGTLAVGSAVAQTNNSTTIAVASNGQSLPQSTINVATTVGFPTSGTIRILTNGASGGVQVVTYSGTGATTFTGCTGGTGVMTTGNSVSSPPIAGTADIHLVGTDFGNRIHHGDGYSPNNSGHIFSTTTGSIFDFWVNAVTQLQLSANSDPADSFIATMGVGPIVNSPKLYQIVQPNTGANNGFNFKVAAQAGQQQAGGANNNNGGNIVLASGAPGTGGAGTAGVNGSVDLNTGATLKVRVFPTTAASAGDNNSILYLENLFRVDTAQTNPLFRQDLTAGATGNSYTIQAQNAATTGGALVLTSGTGATTAGNVQLQTGGVDKQIVHPTFNEFRDTAEALRITPVSAGTTQITYASTVTAAQINQTTTASATGANMTIQSQNAATTGGALTFTTGTGATNPGNMVFQIGGTTLLTLFNTAATPNTLQWLGTTTAPIINQQTTGGAGGATLTLQAQNAVTTGGTLALTSGTGTTAGNVNLQTGAITKVSVNPTFTTFNDTTEAYRITPVSSGATTLEAISTATSVTYRQGNTAGATGSVTTLQAQNAATTGGALVVTSGTGTTAGNVQLQTGAVDRVIVHPTFTEFRDTAEALRITPVSAGTTQITFASTDTAVQVNQTTTGSATGATMTVQAQNAATTGGDLNLTSGTGATTNGNLNLQAGGSTTARVHTNKLSFLKGWRRNITSVTGTYQVLVTDDYLAITTIAASFTITMPATPTSGDTYTIKDASGTAATNNVTVSGNGVNIDGTATITISQNYSAVVLTYTGTTWSIT